MDVRERQRRFFAGARARAERLVTAAAMSRADVAAADEAGEATPAGDDQVEQVPELLSVGIEAGGGDDATLDEQLADLLAEVEVDAAELDHGGERGDGEEAERLLVGVPADAAVGARPAQRTHGRVCSERRCRAVLGRRASRGHGVRHGTAAGGAGGRSGCRGCGGGCFRCRGCEAEMSRRGRQGRGRGWAHVARGAGCAPCCDAPRGGGAEAVPEDAADVGERHEALAPVAPEDPRLGRRRDREGGRGGPHVAAGAL
jgi:hypothetical protein